MNTTYTQKEKAIQFHQLHHSAKLLMLPNIWDVLGASLLQDIAYPAIATASASVAYTHGINDGEKLPLQNLLILLKNIASSVNIPVSADIESGYSNTIIELQQNTKQIIQTGIVGINIEDTIKETNTLYPIHIQIERIKTIRNIANQMDIPLFINARSDVYLYEKEFPTPDAKHQELINRAIAYKEAGANCFFPIAIRQQKDIENLVKHLSMPINILTLPGIPDIHTLQQIGVARVSLGPSFLKIAIQAMKKLATQLKNNQGLTHITENQITTDYLKTILKL